MAKTKLPIVLPFHKPLNRSAFDAVRFPAYSIFDAEGTITVRQIDDLARPHAMDATHRFAISSSVFDYLHAFGTPRTASPLKSNAAERWAALIHDVYAGRLTMRQIAKKHGVKNKRYIPQIMKAAGHTYNHDLRRWEPPLADRHYKAAKRKVAAQKAWVKENNARCHWVSYPFGSVDIGAICTLKMGVQLKERKVNDCYVGRGRGAYNSPSSLGYLAGGQRVMGNSSYLAQNPKAMRYLLSQKVTLGIPKHSEYPALIWPNGQLVFLHKMNYLLARGELALPAGTQLHHIDNNPRNASAINTVAFLGPEHEAWHSRKG